MPRWRSLCPWTAARQGSRCGLGLGPRGLSQREAESGRPRSASPTVWSVRCVAVVEREAFVRGQGGGGLEFCAWMKKMRVVITGDCYFGRLQGPNRRGTSAVRLLLSRAVGAHSLAVWFVAPPYVQETRHRLCTYTGRCASVAPECGGCYGWRQSTTPPSPAPNACKQGSV